jgi:methylated-DNA-[protein]-cysteine S-methyltransferase
MRTLTLQALPRHLQAQTRWTSPLGGMLLARTADGLAGLWFDGQKDHPGALAAPERPDDSLLRRTIDQLRRYFDAGGGQRPGAAEAQPFDLPLDLHGTAFQRAVWQALCRIAPGQTCSYGDIAQAVGSPRAVRAVGAAVGRNPVSVIVPCHRVIGRDGSLTGYAGGLERKQALLRLEGRA